MERRALGLEVVMHLEVTETPRVTIKPAGTFTLEIGPIHEKPHKKHRTRNTQAHPNMKREPWDKQIKDFHINTNTDLTGRRWHRAS